LMVPEKHLSRFAGLNQALHGGLNIIAPPLGALLMSLLQFYQVISVDVITAIIAITPLLFIRIPRPERKDAAVVVTPKTVLLDVREGFKYLKNWKGMLYLAILAAILNFLLAPAGTLLPLMVTQHFQKGVWELSLVESALGIGIVIGGVILGIWGGFKDRMMTSLMGVVGIGLGVLLFGLAPSNMLWMGVAGTAILGLANPIANGPLMAIMQSKIAPEMQGRVMGMTNSLCMMMMPISLMISAPIAEFLGLRVWYWAGGGLVILIVCAARFVPSIMNLDKPAPELVTSTAV